MNPARRPADASVPPAVADRLRWLDGAEGLRVALEPPDLELLAAHLAVHGTPSLAKVPRARRLAVWQEVAAAFLDPESPERRRLLPLLLDSSRLSPEGLTEGLETVLAGFSGPAAERAAARAAVEFPDDASVAPGYAAASLAGNLPGLAVQVLLPALLVGRPLLVKSASTEPWFAPAWISALAAREPALGEAFAAVRFEGSDRAAVSAAFSRADPLFAYGGSEAMAHFTTVAGSRLVAHGPKASLALVGNDSDLVGTARGLARDIALFDQRGCLSVQAVYTTANAAELAAALAWALLLESARLPPGPLDLAAAAAVQQLRAEAALRGTLVDSREMPLAAGTVLCESRLDFRPSPGLRTVRVYGVRALSEVLPALAPWQGQLQGAALAGSEAEVLTEELLALGLSRVAAPGELQAADAGWANGGIDAFAALAAARTRITFGSAAS